MSIDKFDFDFWMNAYKEDPDGYEELAKAYIHQVIDAMDRTEEQKNKLKGLYWKCRNDPEIRKIEDPFQRAQRASTLMWQELRKLPELWFKAGVEAGKMSGHIEELKRTTKDD